jgi:hypothetical protein
MAASVCAASREEQSPTSTLSTPSRRAVATRTARRSAASRRPRLQPILYSSRFFFFEFLFGYEGCGAADVGQVHKALHELLNLACFVKVAASERRPKQPQQLLLDLVLEY